MADQDHKQRRFRDEAERGGRARGGGVEDGTGAVMSYRGAGGGGESRGHSGYDDNRGGFVDDYHGGPGSGGYARDKGGRGSGLGAFGFNDDAREAGHRGRGPKNYQRSDERIREDLNDRLTDDPHVDASEIEVSVSNREVTLTGTVHSRFEKRHAEDIAESVSGVAHVQNNLRVGSSSGSGMGSSTLTGAGGSLEGSSGSASGGGLNVGATGTGSIAGTDLTNRGGSRRRTPTA